jgi:RHS repeat-associated protein
MVGRDDPIAPPSLTVAHCDEQGSLIALTAADGTILHTAHYGPHGEDWGASGENPTPFAWLGGWGVMRMGTYLQTPNSQLATRNSQPLTLYHTRHRLYEPSLRRFLSPDPIGLSGGLNLYAYANGDPLSYIDPLGLSPFSAAVKGFFESFGTSEHWNDTLEFYKGEGDAVVSTAVGIYNFVRQPIQTLEGIGGFIGSAIGDPSGTWDVLRYNLQVSLSDPRSAGELTGHGLITIATIMAPFAKSASAAQLSDGMVYVTRWGRPGLETGDFVMLGEKTYLNYILSGKWQWWGSNEFAGFTTGRTWVVPSESLLSPGEAATATIGDIRLGWVKQFLRQRSYWGAPKE